MMDELKADTKAGLVNLIFGIYENDVKEVLRALEQIEVYFMSYHTLSIHPINKPYLTALSPHSLTSRSHPVPPTHPLYPLKKVLRKGVDKFAIEKVARVFLRDFNEGINQGGKWLNEMSPEEQRRITMEKRKQLGADLFSVGSDVPFKFPTTFTFVFRAFTSLDGIGKGLDPAYDLVRLAQPFLKELVDLRDGSAFISLLKTWGKKLVTIRTIIPSHIILSYIRTLYQPHLLQHTLSMPSFLHFSSHFPLYSLSLPSRFPQGWRPIDIANTVQQPRKVAYLEETVERMEQGDLKLRVRVLESERGFQRMELVGSSLLSPHPYLSPYLYLSLHPYLFPHLYPFVCYYPSRIPFCHLAPTPFCTLIPLPSPLTSPSFLPPSLSSPLFPSLSLPLSLPLSPSLIPSLPLLF